MQSIDFGKSQSNPAHECDSYQHGDWIVFRCPSCPDYERRLNWRTGEIKVKNSQPGIMHTGTHVPHHLDGISLN